MSIIYVLTSNPCYSTQFHTKAEGWKFRFLFSPFIVIIFRGRKVSRILFLENIQENIFLIIFEYLIFLHTGGVKQELFVRVITV